MFSLCTILLLLLLYLHKKCNNGPLESPKAGYDFSNRSISFLSNNKTSPFSCLFTFFVSTKESLLISTCAHNTTITNCWISSRLSRGDQNYNSIPPRKNQLNSASSSCPSREDNKIRWLRVLRFGSLITSMLSRAVYMH